MSASAFLHIGGVLSLLTCLNTAHQYLNGEFVDQGPMHLAVQCPR